MSSGDFTDSATSAALDRTVARGVFVVAAFAVVTSIARLAQDAAIAWRYGTGPVVDAYYFVANLASWPVAVALSVLTLLVVPLEAGLQQAGNAGQLQRFRAELLGAVLVLAVVSFPLAWWLLTLVAGGPLGGLEPHTAALAVAGVPAIVAGVPLGLIGALLAAWLVSSGRHMLTLFEALPPLVLIIVVLLVPGTVLFWGTAAGVALQTIVMVAALAASQTMPAPRTGLSSAAWRGIGAGALMLVIAQVISALLPLVDAFFAARLGEGTLATLNFANRMVLGIQGLAGLALQRVGLPVLSRLVATSPAQARLAALRWAGIMAGAGLLVGCVVALLADPLVAILFERGRFTAADREQVASLLRWGMLQLVPFLAGVAVVTALASASAWSSLAAAAALGLVVKVVASALLAADHGAVGLQVATALLYATTTTVAWVALRRRLRHAVP